MEQVAALGGGKVESSGVARALGLAGDDAFSRLVDAIAANDAVGGLTLVANLASSGADLRRFVADALDMFRGLFLAQYAPNLQEIVDEWHTLADKMAPLWAKYGSNGTTKAEMEAEEAAATAHERRREGRARVRLQHVAEVQGEPAPVRRHILFPVYPLVLPRPADSPSFPASKWYIYQMPGTLDRLPLLLPCKSCLFPCGLNHNKPILYLGGNGSSCFRHHTGNYVYRTLLSFSHWLIAGSARLPVSLAYLSYPSLQ